MCIKVIIIVYYLAKIICSDVYFDVYVWNKLVITVNTVLKPLIKNRYLKSITIYESKTIMKKIRGKLSKINSKMKHYFVFSFISLKYLHLHSTI